MTEVSAREKIIIRHALINVKSIDSVQIPPSPPPTHTLTTIIPKQLWQNTDRHCILCLYIETRIKNYLSGYQQAEQFSQKCAQHFQSESALQGIYSFLAYIYIKIPNPTQTNKLIVWVIYARSWTGQTGENFQNSIGVGVFILFF